MRQLFLLLWTIEFFLVAQVISDNETLFRAIESEALPYAIFIGIIAVFVKHWSTLEKLLFKNPTS